MHLDARASYLSLHDAPGGLDRRLSLHPDFEHALAGWTVGSRMSPVWRIRAEPVSIRTAALIPQIDRGRVTFLGPVQPALLFAEVPALARAEASWATLGCFNIVALTEPDDEGEALAETLADWSRKAGFAFEQWRLNGGIICQVQQHVLPPRQSGALSRLAAHAEHHRHPAVRTSFQENLVATATSLARAAAVYPAVHDEIEQVAESIGEIMARFAADELTMLEMQSRLLTMNAALSRFSSQAFSGIPPIRGTECHFWIHSLLGTGSANIALASLVASVQTVLGEARLPERLELLGKITTGVPSSADLTSDPALLDFDLLDAVSPLPAASGKVVPLITYFSGRDGFSSHVQTLSAPLTTLAECNSLRSNLLTVTHEISHIFVQAALAKLSPTPGKIKEFQFALGLLAPHYEAANMLEAAQQLFLEAVVAMAIEDRPDGRPYGRKELPAELPGIIERSRPEVQEILVHAFDFLYFHAGEPAYYIKNIWHSWCAIPGIADRIPEYLMRTLCAVSSNLLRQKPRTRFDAALREVKAVLVEIEPDIGLKDNYAGRALAYICRMEAEPELMGRVCKQYSVRMRLVRLVRAFLFSDKLAAKLFNDPHIGGGDGYRSKKPLIYDSSPVGNALQFLRGNLKQSPSEAESLWILHALAFDISPSPLGAA